MPDFNRAASRYSGSEIAVIGLAGKFPGANTLDEFWDNLKNGRESITFFSDEVLIRAGVSPEALKLPNYVKAKGVIGDYNAFDADFFSYAPRDAERMDPQIRILHEVAWEAFENAGYNPESYNGAIGAYLGANDNLEWIRRVNAAAVNYGENIDHFLLNYRDYVATRMSFKLNLRGPSFTLLSACSTSLLALHLACQSIRSGECDMALAGGTSIMYPEISGYVYQEGLMLSSDGHCRPFDAKADGTVFGDGVAVVVLKSLKAALRDRDHIHAVIRGSAVNNDGNGKVGFTTPSIEGQRCVIEAAQKAAGVTPDSITYVETHGTGTKAGDPIEFEALRQAFRTKKRNFCGIGAVKTNIGHVNVAAGVSAFIKTVLMLQHRTIPPNPHFESPNPAINLAESPFFINTLPLPWRSKNNPLRAGVSAFGFGGTNAHAILEEAPRQRHSNDPRPSQLLVCSGRSESALGAVVQNLAGHLRNNSGINLADVAYTLGCGRKHFDYRHAVVAKDIPEAISQLEKNVAPVHAGKKHRSLVFMFPGQGSQFAGMGAELYKFEPVFRKTVDYCGEILKDLSGTEILDSIGASPKEKKTNSPDLIDTAIAQPAIFVYSYALAQLYKSWGIRPDAVIGHSLGEIVAACVAGVMSLEDALAMVARRGKLMQQLPGGAMLAVPLPEDEITPYLGKELSLAAVNAPSLCVVSGNIAPMKKLKLLLREKGIPAQYLATSHAFHSHLMKPILGEFSKINAGLKFSNPAIPVMSTLTGNWIRDGEMDNMDYWTSNIRQPVRFSDGIARLLDEHEGILLEVGPGKTLTGLAKLHLTKPRSRPVFASINGNGEQCSELALLYATVGRLWANGVEVQWEKFHVLTKHNRLPLPTYPFERRQYGPLLPAYAQQQTSSWSRLTKNGDIADWCYVPSWKRTPPPYFAMTGITERQTWLIFTDAYGVGAAVAKKLNEHGQDIVTVVPGNKFSMIDNASFVMGPARRDDYDLLFNALASDGKHPQRIIHCWTVTPPALQAIPWDQAESFQDLSFLSLLFLSQVLGTQNFPGEVHLSVVSNFLHDILGGEFVIPDKSTILGPVKVVSQEYPDIRCCSIDIVLPEPSVGIPSMLIDQVLSEAITNSLDPVVAFRGEHRWVQTFDRVRLDSSLERSEWVREQGTYLITGGLGGIGLVLAEFFARTSKANLILTGRSPLPPRQDWANWLNAHAPEDPVSRKILKIEKLEGLGSQVRLITGDVTDREAMRKGIEAAIEDFGTIHGVVHAAGVHGEGIIQLKKGEIAKSILAPKIKGTIILDDLLKDVDLDFFILCSSIASFLGGIGLVDYCAANAFMDAYVSNPRCKNRNTWLSINWDMWGEVGMGLKTKMPDELQEWLEKELRDGITSAEGVAVLQRMMTWKKSKNIIASTRDLQARIDLWVKREFIKEKESLMEDENAKPRYLRPNLSTEYLAPATDIEMSVAAIWSKLFGVEKIGRHDNFYELGGHSLLATTLVSKLRKEFNINLSIRDILDHPVLSELSEFIQASIV